MNQTLRLPACRRYVKDGDAADKLYTLAAQTAPCHVEGISKREFHSLLLAAHDIPTEHPLPKYIENVSCFTVISEYKCGYICHMCPYAKRNKNEMETEESLLLSYAMEDYNHLCFLKNAGLDSSKFLSLIYSVRQIACFALVMPQSFNCGDTTIMSSTYFVEVKGRYSQRRSSPKRED